MAYKTYFVYDKKTGYILSGYHILGEDADNPFTKPYSCPEFHSNGDKCPLDYIFHSSIREGLKNLKYEDLVVCENDGHNTPRCHFVKNENYSIERYQCKGWWKLYKDTLGNWITSNILLKKSNNS